MSTDETMSVLTVTPENKSMEDIVALCKRRGFVFPASEIYGGLNGFWDYGPLGTALKNNLRDQWWRDMVDCPPDGPDGESVNIVGLDSSIIQNPKVWEASGHVGGFNDPMVDCTETKRRYRADHLQVSMARVERSNGTVENLALIATLEGDGEDVLEAKATKLIKKSGGGKYVSPEPDGIGLYPDMDRDTQLLVIGPDSNKPGSLTEPRQFNLMFKTFVGAMSGEDNVAYLRPETAQGIFANYKNVLDTMRVKVPFGIAQIGKSFRNEVTPRNFIFRSREFEQMEMEFFCHPDDAKKWYEFWVQARLDWWKSVGVDPGNLIRREHDADELAHYSTACADVEYKYPFTAPAFGELEGIAHRGCFDLTQHQEHSKTKLSYFDQEKNERYLPHVIEPAAGLTRGVLALLTEAFTPDDSRPSKVFMKFHPRLAPIQAAVFPLVNKDGMPEVANKLYKELRKTYSVQFDAKQNIGKRYARMDEAGAPFCFTIDGDTMENNTITVRHRDTCTQETIGIDHVANFMAEKVNG